jgi:lysozyme family protein
MNDDDIIIEHVLRYEGRYVNNPDDRGGPTNFGITARTLGAWRNLGRPATAAEVFSMSRAEAKAIYRKQYIIDPGFDAIEDPDLRMIVVDCGVLYGTRRATMWLQTALGVTADGIFGDDTIHALNGADPHAVARSILKQRFQRIQNVVEQSPRQMVFYRGWMNRTNDLLQYA